MRILTFLLASVSGMMVFAQSQYVVNIYTSVVKDDKIRVKVELPTSEGITSTYSFPKVVPGTYAIADYGKFVSEIKALDANGAELKIEKLNVNQYTLPANTASVEYWMNDSYDYDKSGVFEPAGTSFIEDTVFLLNMMGVVGYIEGKDKLPYKVFVHKNDDLYGSTTLPVVNRSTSKDEFFAQNYFYLHDNPILYSKADTASVQVGNCKVMVAAYTPTGKLSASFIMESVQDLFEATREYMGGTLPASQYMIISYGATKMSGSFGALEHWTSTAFYMPDYANEQMAESLRDITAHEFLHIVTPLNVHSYEIADFNFSNPKMSKHLWLYEGMTEYTSHYVQLRTGRIQLDEFLNRMAGKMEDARRNYSPYVPFTELSKNCLHTYHEQYGNVYQKGALINWALDLTLRKLSNGAMGTPELMQKLTAKYGKNQPFDDNALFDVITELTYPEIREFFVRYVESSEPLPFDSIFAEFGIDYQAEINKNGISLGKIDWQLSENQRIQVGSIIEYSSQILSLGLQEGDELVSINGIELTLATYESGFESLMATPEGKKIAMVVMRNGKKKSIKAKAIYEPIEEYNVIEIGDINNANLKKWANQI